MDEEFYIAESLKVDKEGILFLADLWEKIESFSGVRSCSILMK